MGNKHKKVSSDPYAKGGISWRNMGWKRGHTDTGGDGSSNQIYL
jgi:hypothetical protein